MDFNVAFRRDGLCPPATSAFSLVELLVVIAIGIVLAGMATLGLNQMLQSSRLEQAGQIVMDEFHLARQLAVSRNGNVEIRFIETARNGVTAFQCIQSGQTGDDGNFIPASRLTCLPEGIIFSARTELSSLIGDLPKKEHTSPGSRYTAFVIRPSGFIEPQPEIGLTAPWFVTILPEKDGEKNTERLTDFVTVQIDPWTSRPTMYRP